MALDDVRAALTDLSDVERRTAEGVLFGSATRCTEAGKPRLAKFWQTLAKTVVEERDRRRTLEEHARSILDDDSLRALAAELDRSTGDPQETGPYEADR